MRNLNFRYVDPEAMNRRFYRRLVRWVFFSAAAGLIIGRLLWLIAKG